MSWDWGERSLRRCSGQAPVRAGWLRCCGPRRSPGFPPRGNDGCVTLTPALSVKGEGVWEPEAGGHVVRPYGGCVTLTPALSRQGRGVCGAGEAGGHVGPPLRRVSHPHPNPLPSKERGCGSREAGGHVGPPLRRVCHPHPSSSPVKGEGVWESGSGRTHGSAPTAVESPRLSVSRVEGEGVGAGCSSRTMCTMSSLAAAILWWVLKPSVLSCITSSRNSMMVPASAVWARMSLAMRNSVYPREDSEEVSRKGGRGVQGHGHQGPLRGGGRGRPGWGRPRVE